MSLKEKLLKLGVFIDNEYLDMYIKMVLDNAVTKRIKFETQKHHIIPKKYYKINNLEVDNSKENIVNLLYSDHILAHYLLCLCTDKNSCLYYHSLLAFDYLYYGRTSKIPNTNIIKDKGKQIIKDADIINYLYQESVKCKSIYQKGVGAGIKKGPMSAETKLKISLAHKGKAPWNKGKSGLPPHTEETKNKMSAWHTGKILIHKDELHKKVSRGSLDKYLKQGFEVGYSEAKKQEINLKTKNIDVRTKISQTLRGHSVSEITKQKISQKLAGRKRTYEGPKRVWVNNKIQEIMVLEDYLNEYLEKNKDFKKGRITKPFTRKETKDNDN